MSAFDDLKASLVAKRGYEDAVLKMISEATPAAYIADLPATLTSLEDPALYSLTADQFSAVQAAFAAEVAILCPQAANIVKAENSIAQNLIAIAKAFPVLPVDPVDPTPAPVDPAPAS